jgi:hypothetical protein
MCGRFGWLLANGHNVGEIMDRVAAMKEQSITTTIPLELEVVEEGERVTYLCQMRFAYYK